MKRILLIATAMATLSSCSKYDDSELWEKVNSMDERLTNVEKKLDSMNESLNSLQSLYDAISKRLYITKVTSNGNGYTITFSDNSTANIYNGKDGINGTNGKDGKDAPIINVKEYNGVYYWTQTINGSTTWLLDPNGSMIKAEGSTPLLRVNSDGYWEVSYNNGNSYTMITDAQGNWIKATNSYESIFKSVEVSDGNLNITLADGSEVSIPIGADIVSHKAVDLGLSVKWATSNVGAENEYARGGLYVWGDATGNRGLLGTDSSLMVDRDNICGTDYDIAKAKWGGKWRLPTKAELLELNQFQWLKTTINGVDGIKVLGRNGKSLFLPGTGYNYATAASTGAVGWYWTGESYLPQEGMYFGRMIYAGYFYVDNFRSFVMLEKQITDWRFAVRPVQDK